MDAHSTRGIAMPRDTEPEGLGHVRQHGGNSCVDEVAVDHAATVVICGVVASINVGMSSAIGYVCM